MFQVFQRDKMKGFIGPIGDDLPSIMAILLALSIFFAGLNFTLESYNQRLDSFNQLKGTLDIARNVTSQGLVPGTTTAFGLKAGAENIARSYGLDFCVTFDSSTDCTVGSSCKDDWVRFKYLVAFDDPAGKIELRELEVCAG